MSLTMDDLITREGILDALNAYSHGLDQRNWDILAQAWTAGGTFHAPHEGVPEPITWQELREFLSSRNDATRLSGQHLLNNTWFQIDGDTAHTITEVTWRTLQQLDQPNMVYEIHAGGIYVDDLEHTSDGWRIARRYIWRSRRRTATASSTPRTASKPFAPPLPPTGTSNHRRRPPCPHSPPPGVPPTARLPARPRGVAR